MCFLTHYENEMLGRAFGPQLSSEQSWTDPVSPNKKRPCPAPAQRLSVSPCSFHWVLLAQLPGALCPQVPSKAQTDADLLTPTLLPREPMELGSSPWHSEPDSVARMVAQACNQSTWEVEAGRSIWRLRPSLTTENLRAVWVI